MILKTLTPGEFSDIYQEHLRRDFPRNELRPLRGMLHLFSAGRYLALGLYDGEENGRLLAYGSFILGSGGRPSFLDYFGVPPELRRRGYGSMFLSMLASVLPDDAVILEVESMESAANEEEKLLRQRRIDFYIHAGARVTRLRGHVFGVDYALLCLPLRRGLTDAEALDGILSIYRSSLPRLIFHKYIRYEMSSNIRP